jgi:hypothetical protein
MAIQLIADETYPDRTAKVYSSKALRVSEAYNYYSVPSATATGAILTSAGILHSVIFGSSAAGTKFWLFDSAGTANDIGNSASAVARFEGGAASKQVIFNALLNSGLCYRLSAISQDGITIVYSAAS